MTGQGSLREVPRGGGPFWETSGTGRHPRRIAPTVAPTRNVSDMRSGCEPGRPCAAADARAMATAPAHRPCTRRAARGAGHAASPSVDATVGPSARPADGLAGARLPGSARAALPHRVLDDGQLHRDGRARILAGQLRRPVLRACLHPGSSRARWEWPSP